MPGHATRTNPDVILDCILKAIPDQIAHGQVYAAGHGAKAVSGCDYGIVPGQIAQRAAGNLHILRTKKRLLPSVRHRGILIKKRKLQLADFCRGVCIHWHHASPDCPLPPPSPPSRPVSAVYSSSVS
jgi:hypothetical protein